MLPHPLIVPPDIVIVLIFDRQTAAPPSALYELQPDIIPPDISNVPLMQYTDPLVAVQS